MTLRSGRQAVNRETRSFPHFAGAAPVAGGISTGFPTGHCHSGLVKRARCSSLVAGAWVLTMVVAAGLLLLPAAARWTRPEPDPAGTPAEVAQLLRELTSRPGLHRRLATRWVEKVNPAWSRLLPAFLRLEPVQRRNLEACHALMARGPAVQPVLPRLLSTLRSADSTTAFYALLVIVYSGQPAADVMSLARQSPGIAEALVRQCAGLLGTEDERLREFSWHCLEAAGAEARRAAPRLQDLAATADPELSARARHLLQTLAKAEAPPAGF